MRRTRGGPARWAPFALCGEGRRRARGLRALGALGLLVAVLVASFVPAVRGDVEATPSVLLTFDELVELYEREEPSEPLRARLDALLETLFVDNAAWEAGSRARKPTLGCVGRGLRVVQWNVERGIEFEETLAAFRGGAAFDAFVDRVKYPPGSAARAAVLAEADQLRDADVVVLNEADWGLARSRYQHVVANLAAALEMNYAFGVEFVEVDPYTIGTADPDGAVRVEPVTFEKERTRALHGTAILSRYRLDNVRIHRFETVGHRWYADEKHGVSALERGKRKAGEVAFLEAVGREVRRGGRMALFADIADPDLPEGRITVVATHLENRTTPSNRVGQLEEVLALVANCRHPVILAGDMNTSGSDATPTSIRYLIKRKFGSAPFWSRRLLTYATGYGIVVTAPLDVVGYFHSYRDPTRRGIPLVAPNSERAFFQTLETFRFADGGAFDFRGDRGRTSNGRAGTLANSNARAAKGFATTWRAERTFGPSGKMKLDWIFVKPARLTEPRDRAGSYRFAPHNGTTLAALNYSVGDRISDHNPIFVDLPFDAAR